MNENMRGLVMEDLKQGDHVALRLFTDPILEREFYMISKAKYISKQEVKKYKVTYNTPNTYVCLWVKSPGEAYDTIKGCAGMYPYPPTIKILDIEEIEQDK